MRKPLILLATVLASPAAATANPVVNVGTFNLLPNTPGQTIIISITDGGTPSVEDIEGAEITNQIGSGSSTGFPRITNVDLLTGTVWPANSSVTTPSGGSTNQFQTRSIQTPANGNFINANGRLETLTVDTQGVFSGTFQLKMTGTLFPANDTLFTNGVGGVVPSTITNGTIVVPEPATNVLAGLSVSLLLRRRRRAATAQAVAR